MNIKDKAEQAEKDVHLTGDMAYSTYRLESKQLTPADKISDEGEFPQYGDFAKVTIPSSGNGADPELWAEVCTSLAESLVDEGISEGEMFRVGHVEKVDGEWQVKADQASERHSEKS